MRSSLLANPNQAQSSSVPMMASTNPTALAYNGIPNPSNNNMHSTIPITRMPQHHQYQPPPPPQQQPRVVSPRLSPTLAREQIILQQNRQHSPPHLPSQLGHSPMKMNQNAMGWQQQQQHHHPQLQQQINPARSYDSEELETASDVSSIHMGSIRPDPNYDPAKDPLSPENIDKPFVAPLEITIRVVKGRRRKTLGSQHSSTTHTTMSTAGSTRYSVEEDKHQLPVTTSEWLHFPKHPTTQNGSGSIPELGLINSSTSECTDSNSFSGSDQFQSAEERMYLEEDLLELQEGQNNNNNNNNNNFGRQLEQEWEEFAIDLTQYALKYIGCSNIRTWSDDLAAEDNNDSVLKMDKFVVLRLCPRDSCSNYNKYGCLEQFGDYLIPMETYLQTMAETFFTQYQEYCETCYECMNGVNNDDGGNYQNYNYNYNNNNGGNYGNNYNNYNNNNYGGNYGNNYNNNGNRRLNDDAYNQYDDAYSAADDAAQAAADDDYDEVQDCEYYSICALYKDTCQEYTNLGFELEDYFECAEFNIGNSAGYLGPHCASDGKTISMGIFNDDQCNDYSADISEVSSYMAVNQENDLEAYYSDNCISCLASDGYTLEGANDDDQYNIITDICGALYDESAKCNKYMGNDGNYASSNQEGQEDTVCNFIENLLTKSYNEYGEIILQEVGWKTYIPNVETIRKMQKWQKYALTLSIFGSLGMYLYALYLYRAIQGRKRTWYPRGRKGYSTGYPGDPITMDGRLHSGIIQGRSHSSGHFGMKNGGVLS